MNSIWRSNYIFTGFVRSLLYNEEILREWRQLQPLTVLEVVIIDNSLATFPVLTNRLLIKGSTTKYVLKIKSSGVWQMKCYFRKDFFPLCVEAVHLLTLGLHGKLSSFFLLLFPNSSFDWTFGTVYIKKSTFCIFVYFLSAPII